jgi:hypothetical protein
MAIPLDACAIVERFGAFALSFHSPVQRDHFARQTAGIEPFDFFAARSTRAVSE